MLYPAELRGRYLTVYLCRTADAMTGKNIFNHVTASVVRAGRGVRTGREDLQTPNERLLTTAVVDLALLSV